MARLVQTWSLYLLLVVIALRPLIAEGYRSSRSGISAALAEVTDPLPAATLVLDAVILLAAVGWLLARLPGGAARYRRCGIEAGAVLVVLAGAVSCCVAGDKRAAINATVDWLCLPLLTVVLAQLLREPGRIRVTLCVVLASAAAQAAECFNQVLDTFPETERLYEAGKEDFWASANVELDSPQVALYERRLYGREATGFLAHSNVAGAYLVMTGLAALGLACARLRASNGVPGKALAAGVAVLGCVMLVAVTLTGSKGAMSAGVAVLVLWAVRLIFSQRLHIRRRTVLIGAWGLVAVATGVVVGLGLARGGLPGSSLDFRWQYWTTSWPLFADHWTTGVGRENFGAHYLQYKTIGRPEEVANPHNFLVAAATEWGLLGAVGVVLMLISGVVAATRTRWGEHYDRQPTGRSLLAWGVAVGTAVFAARLFLLGSDQPAYLLYATSIPLVVWGAAFAVCAGAADGQGRHLPSLATGVSFGLLAFLLQDTINFAAFVPGAATTFFALLGVSIADGPGPPEHTGGRVQSSELPVAGARPSTRNSHLATRTHQGGERTFARYLPAVMAIGVLIAYFGWVLVPVARAGFAIRRARASAGVVGPGPYDVQTAYVKYLRAAEADPLDPTPRAEAAAYLIGYAATTPTPLPVLDRALELIDAAIERSPYSTSLHRQKLQMCRRAQALTGRMDYLNAAIQPARRVVELYPQSPDAHADLGATLLDVGRANDDRALLRQAADHLGEALQLDDARPAWEELRRMPPRERERIRTLLAEAAASVGATQP